MQRSAVILGLITAMGLAEGCDMKPASPAPNDDPWAMSRALMLDHDLRGRGIADTNVLAAMAAVPRHLFVPPDIRREAYADYPLPIGEGQTISQPYIVAAMTELLQAKRDDCVLEIGTGSGYQAAVLAGLVAQVYTIEIVEPLGRRAGAALASLGYSNVQVRIGDGYAGWPEHAPFDGIIVTCGATEVPPPLIDQLKPGGKMVIPVGPTLDVQELLVIEKDAAGRVHKHSVMPVRFVPLTGPSVHQGSGRTR